MQRQPRLLTAPEQAAIRELADAIAAWWHAASTTVAERKAIIRQVVERVVVTVVGESERVEVTMMWAGGSQPQGTLIRPVGRLEQLSSYPQLCDRIRTLAAQGQSATAIAACLNAEGYRPAKQAVCFNRGSVEELIQRLGLRPPAQRRHEAVNLGSDEWWLGDLARALAMPRATLETWIKRGWGRARQEHVLGRSQWVIWADQAEVERLRRHRQQPAGAVLHDRWVGRDQATDGSAGMGPGEQTASAKPEVSGRKSEGALNSDCSKE